MKIYGIKRHPEKCIKNKMDIDFLGGPEEINYVLRNSDFLILTVPLTHETRGMIGEHELKLMKKTAFIINSARGPILEEKALYKALNGGYIAGAALNSWWVPHWWDPLWNPTGNPPSKYPFWELPNVIATPHNVGSSDIPNKSTIKIIEKNIKQVFEGKEPINKVDEKLRY
jgi:D-3-phosphoglycerate dehydrogenase